MTATTDSTRSAGQTALPPRGWRRLVADRWMFFPVLILGWSVVLVVMTVRASLSGQGAGVERDYYRQAVEWEEVQLQRARNERLRWSVTPSFAPSPVDPRLPRLHLAVTDRHGIPIERARIEVEAIPVTMVQRGAVVPLSGLGGGRYEGDLPAAVAGQWEFRVRVEQGEEIYTDTFRRVLQFGAPSGRTG